MDLVSVVIPTYNRAHLIKRAIKSVLNQTYKNTEIIVLDDASADDTENQVKSFNDSRIRYLRHSENKGVSAARNTGIQNSGGRYIAFLDSDDEFVPEKIAEQKEYFSKLNPVPGLIATNAFFEEQGNIRLDAAPEKHSSQYIAYDKNRFPTSDVLARAQTWMVDKECLDNIGLFDENLKIYEDRDLLVRMAKSYPIFYIDKPLSIIHVVEDHLFSLGRMGMDFIKAKETFLQKHFDWMNSDKTNIIKFYSDTADGLIKLNEKEKAREYYLKIVKRAPMKISSLRKFFQTFF